MKSKISDEGCPAKIVLDLPEACNPNLVGALKDLAATLHRLAGKRGRHGDFTQVEHEVARVTARVEAELLGVVLSSLDVDAPVISVDGRRYRRLDAEEKTYRTLAGPVVIERHLYRATDVRNGPTLDPIAVRVGTVGGSWLPGAAKAMAHGLAIGTSREAAAHAKQLGRLPYGRSSFERVGHLVGAEYCEHRAEIEDALAEGFEVPREATGVSISLDRAAIPMEEVADDGEGVVRAFRMAHCATVTFHDHDARALHVTRYGRMPTGDVVAMDDALHHDLTAALAERPDLKVSVLADGAVELWARLEVIIDGVADDATRLVDYWHLCEYLGAAAHEISGGQEARRILERWKGLLLDYSGAWSMILRELEATPGPMAANAARYIDNHRDLLDYATAWATGMPIGSGNVEATCKSLLGMRMKRSGSRWKTETGERVIQLRALELSDRWDDGIAHALKPLRRTVRRAAA